jgi:hypothetical protein
MALFAWHPHCWEELGLPRLDLSICWNPDCVTKCGRKAPTSTITNNASQMNFVLLLRHHFHDPTLWFFALNQGISLKSGAEGLTHHFTVVDQLLFKCSSFYPARVSMGGIIPIEFSFSVSWRKDTPVPVSLVY